MEPDQSSYPRSEESSNQETSDKQKAALIERIEWIVAILLSVVVLFLLIVQVTHAGALWRDECETLQVARMPKFGEMMANLRYTSFPILLPLVVRGYTTLLGTSDVSMRCFGLAVGLAFIGIAWFHARSVGNGVPLILLALVGLNPTLLTAATWVRGYGLGSVLIVLAVTLSAKLVLQPTTGRLLGVLVVYLASMQILLFSGAIVPAIVLAITAVWWYRGRATWIVALLSVAVICGLSYIPYILRGWIEVKPWDAVIRLPMSFESLRAALAKACGEPISIMPGLLAVIILLSLIGAVWRLAVIWRVKPAPQWELLLFSLLIIVGSVAANHAFLWSGQNILTERYFVTLFFTLAAAIDMIFTSLSRFRSIRLVRVAVTVAATVALPFAAWPKITQRQTNIDVVAQTLEKNADPNDLIIISPWSFGISFNWYYQGRTPWLTVPIINEHRVHRYDLLREKMMEISPLGGLEREIREAMKDGKRIWFAGYFTDPSVSTSGSLSPAPDPKFGWFFLPYRLAWTEELTAFFGRHAVRGELFAPPAKSIASDENLPVWVAEGWRD